MKGITRTTIAFLSEECVIKSSFDFLGLTKQEAPVNAYFAVISVPRQSGRSNTMS